MTKISTVTAIVFASLLCSASIVYAGKYNPVLDYGSPAPAWKELPGVDGKKHSMSDLRDHDVIVLFFTCNSCPYAREYEDRVMAFVKKQQEAKAKVAVVAVNVNKIEEDSLDAMKERAKERKFNFTYLYDETQEIAKKYGAIRTPEFFVIGKNRKIAYMGAFDDNPDPTKVKDRHLPKAVASLLDAKTPTVKETVAIGCAIRFERRRRTRRKKDSP